MQTSTTTGQTASNEETIAVLNDLIETCRDGEQGFRTCAENVGRPDLQRMMSERAQQCADGCRELQNEVRTLGGDPEKQSSVAGALHRAWVNVKGTITGRDEESILNECERGEDVAVESYKTALNKNLPENVRNIIQRQYEGVVKNHNQIRDLRNNYRQAS